MREDDSNWFSKWEAQLPSQDELMPLSQSLITPDLASAFDIRMPGSGGGGGGGTTPVSLFHQHSSSSPQLHSHIDNYGVQLQKQHSSSTPQHNSAEFDSSSAELCCGVGGDQEPARTLKRPRLVWTPQLHKRFVDVVAHLGIKNAVPKTIMQLMSVDGLTRENVASHLQKYRLYLKRMQGGNNGAGGGLNGHGLVDTASDQLFASSPVPAHFLHQVTGVPSPGHSPGVGGGVRSNSDHFMSRVPVTALHHQQMVQTQTRTLTPYSQNHHRLMGQFGSIRGNGQLDHPFMSRQAQLGPNRNGMLQGLESGAGNNNSRKVLTLFPNDDD